MAVFDLIQAQDFVGSDPLPNAFMITDSLGRWTTSTYPTLAKAASVGVQTSVSIEKASYTSVDGASSVAVAAALNALAAGINSLGTLMNVIGFTA